MTKVSLRIAGRALEYNLTQKVIQIHTLELQTNIIASNYQQSDGIYYELEYSNRQINLKMTDITVLVTQDPLHISFPLAPTAEIAPWSFTTNRRLLLGLPHKLSLYSISSKLSTWILVLPYQCRGTPKFSSCTNFLNFNDLLTLFHF